MTQGPPQPGQDTATGTDPDARYDTPGYEDKSMGQAGNQDQELVDQLIEDADGDLEAAAERFEQESAGAPALARQAADDHATGQRKADENKAAEPPA